MDRRGLTLLEMLVAISLLVAIAAIAIPVLVRSLDDGTYDTTVEVTMGQLLLARAHAQATGLSVEVVYRTEPARVEARVFDPATGGLDEEDRGAIIAEGWAYRPLAGGVRFTREAPLDDAASAAGQTPPFTLDPADEALLRLAIYLPDGSAVLSEPVWIVATGGRRGQLSVNPWSGLPRVSASPAADPEEQEQEEDEPEPAPEPEVEPEAGADDDDEEVSDDG